VTVLTDDERPFVIYGEQERKARKGKAASKAPSKSTGKDKRP
jgi:manganese/iron transport system ATP-binding protein